MESKLSFSRPNFHQNQFEKCFQWQSLLFWIAFFTQLLHVINVFQANIITSIAFKIGSGSVAQTSTIWKYFVFWLFPDENIINAQTTLSARIIAIRASGWITHEELYISNVEIFDIVITTDMNQREKSAVVWNSVQSPRHKAFMADWWRRIHFICTFWDVRHILVTTLLTCFYRDARFISIFGNSFQEMLHLVFRNRWDKERISQLWLSHIYHQIISKENNFYIQIFLLCFYTI